MVRMTSQNDDGLYLRGGVIFTHPERDDASWQSCHHYGGLLGVLLQTTSKEDLLWNGTLLGQLLEVLRTN